MPQPDPKVVLSRFIASESTPKQRAFKRADEYMRTFSAKDDPEYYRGVVYVYQNHICGIKQSKISGKFLAYINGEVVGSKAKASDATRLYEDKVFKEVKKLFEKQEEKLEKDRIKEHTPTPTDTEAKAMSEFFKHQDKVDKSWK